MKKTLINMGGIILFYLIIVFGIILLNLRFKEINHTYTNSYGVGETY